MINEKGAALLLVFVVMIGVASMALAFIAMANYEMVSISAALHNMQAFYIAEAGLAKARWTLTTGEEEVPWSESDTELGNGTFTVTALDDEGDGTVTTITSSGYIPDDTNPVAERQVVEADITISSGASNNLSEGATPSVEPGQGGDPNLAIDGVSNTKWQATVKGNTWLQLDFGSSTEFDRVIYTGNQINSVVIQYSDNGSDWSTAAIAALSPVNFASVSGRYLRFNMTVANPNHKVQLNELEVYNTAGGSASLNRGTFSTSL